MAFGTSSGVNQADRRRRRKEATAQVQVVCGFCCKDAQAKQSADMKLYGFRKILAANEYCYYFLQGTPLTHVQLCRK